MRGGAELNQFLGANQGLKQQEQQQTAQEVQKKFAPPGCIDLRVKPIRDAEGLRAFWEDDPSIPCEIESEVANRLKRRNVPDAWERAGASLWPTYQVMNARVAADGMIEAPMGFAIKVAYRAALKGK
jgi:hypothetical protein